VSEGVTPTPETPTLCDTTLRDLFLWPDWPWERLDQGLRCAACVRLSGEVVSAGNPEG
jgi:hypothetical protein